MTAAVIVPCAGCGLALPLHDGPTHPYIGASAACWARYGEVLAREYESPALMGLTHRASVDAYAAQHPGAPGPRTIQSVWVHLASLHLILEQRASEATARQIMKKIASQGAGLPWLVPPLDPGRITVAAVADSRPEAHSGEVMRWANEVWSSWKMHHDAIRRLVGSVVADRPAPT